MNSRMERYQNSEDELLPSRIEKNNILYESLGDSELSRVKTNTNVSIIDIAPKEIDIDKIKRYVNSVNQEKTNKRKTIMPEFNEPIKSEPKSNELQKIYDINSVLEKAKLGREVDYEEERYKKLKDTQYDILNKISLEMPKEEKPLEEEFNTNERTIIDLINTVTIHKEDLFSELKSDNDNTQVMKPIEEEALNENLREEIESMARKNDEITSILEDLEKSPLEEKPIEIANDVKPNVSVEPQINKIELEKDNKIDSSFFTNSLTFGKADFEGLEELEKSTKNKSFLAKLGIFLLVCLALATIYVIMTYVLDIKLF